MTGTKNYFMESTEYRKLSGLNQSMLKVYDKNPLLFYRQFILGEPKEEENSWSIGVGSLVDFFLLDCGGNESVFEQTLTEKFGVFTGTRTGSQAFDLADALFSVTMRHTSSDGVVGSSFEERFKEAFSETQGMQKYKGKKWEDGLKDFNEKSKSYFDEKLANIGKTVVDTSQIDKCRQVVDQLKNDVFLSSYGDNSVGLHQDLYNKLVIEWKDRGDISCKSEIDRVIVDKKEETVTYIDYKCLYDNEEFDYLYLKNQYYLQNGFYRKALEMFLEYEGIEHFDIKPMRFLVMDTSVNCRKPLLYVTSEKHTLEALRGFTNNGRHYKGVEELMTDILWAQDSGIWTISRENYANRGIVELKEYS